MFGEYRNVLGADEFDRCEPMPGDKARGLDAAGPELSTAPLRIEPVPWRTDGPDGLIERPNAGFCAWKPGEGCDGVIWNDLPAPDGLEEPPNTGDRICGPDGIAGDGLA